MPHSLTPPRMLAAGLLNSAALHTASTCSTLSSHPTDSVHNTSLTHVQLSQHTTHHQHMTHSLTHPSLWHWVRHNDVAGTKTQVELSRHTTHHQHMTHSLTPPSLWHSESTRKLPQNTTRNRRTFNFLTSPNLMAVGFHNTIQIHAQLSHAMSKPLEPKKFTILWTLPH